MLCTHILVGEIFQRGPRSAALFPRSLFISDGETFDLIVLKKFFRADWFLRDWEVRILLSWGGFPVVCSNRFKNILGPVAACPASRSISYIFPRFRTSMPALKFAHPFFKPDSLQKSPAPY